MIKRFFSLLFFMFAICNLAHASELSSVLQNEKGIQSLNSDSKYFAMKYFLKALESDPLNPLIHINIGIAYLLSEEFENALKSFETANEYSENGTEIKFIAHFNAAIAATRLNKIDLALEEYQKALDINPHSKEVKENIELLWQNGQGEGDGDSKNNQESDKNKEQKDSDQKNNDNDKDKKKDQKNKNYNQEKPKPQPFKSKELSKEDMKKILQEIKNQEQKVRAEENEKGAKEMPNGKDW